MNFPDSACSDCRSLVSLVLYHPMSVPPFANPEITRRIRSEEDATARLIGRIFSLLVVDKLEPGIGSRTSQSRQLDDTETKLSCLAAILDKTYAEVETFLGRPGAISLANIISLTSSEMDTLVEGRAPTEVLNILQTTLDILKKDLLASLNAELPPDLVAIFHETYAEAQRLRAPDWLIEKLGDISEALSVVCGEPEVPVPRLELPEPGPRSPSNVSNLSIQSHGSETPLLNGISHPL
jgi:hypothetical protein